jgi:hypothetical protein
MQFKLALGARAVGIKSRSEDGAAIGTSRAGDGAHHAWGAWAELIGAARSASGRLALVRLVLLILLFRVAVAAVSILSIHKRLRPPVSTDCHNYNSRFCAVELAKLASIQSDCYTRADRALIHKRKRAESRTSDEQEDGTSMFVALWEYEVKPGCEERFEKAYGPEGDWVRLFRNDANYRETRLLRDALCPAVYATLDFWNSRGAYEQFMAGHKAEYQALEAAGQELTNSERRLGWYEMVKQ